MLFSDGGHVKPDNYNPKAREAFGRSLIELGVSVFKAVILLVTALPLTLIVKGIFDGGLQQVSIFDLIDSLSTATKLSILALLMASFFLGHAFRKEGLRHLHELENGNRK